LGVTDPLFHVERFCLVPVKFLKAVSEGLVKQKQQTINADSIAVAKLACLVHGALGGKKHSVSLDVFLPFEKPKDGNVLQDSTIDALKWAMKNEKLPPAVVGIIGAELS
jgi:DNA-binding protein YbaB